MSNWVCPICRTSNPDHFCGSTLQRELLEKKRIYEKERGLTNVPVEKMPHNWRVAWELMLSIGKHDLDTRGYD